MIIVNNSFQPSIVRVSLIIQITFVNLNNGFSDKNKSMPTVIAVLLKEYFQKIQVFKSIRIKWKWKSSIEEDSYNNWINPFLILSLRTLESQTLFDVYRRYKTRTLGRNELKEVSLNKSSRWRCCIKNCSYKFRKIHRKIPVLDWLFF